MDLDGLREAMDSGADIIMLDNFDPQEVVRAVRINAGKARLELSGGIDLTNLGDYLDVVGSVDFISVGKITHSVLGFDFSLKAGS